MNNVMLNIFYLNFSTLLFTPKIKDQGKVLTCKADNGVFPSTNKSSVLNVYYLPIVHVEIGNDVDPSMIRYNLSNLHLLVLLGFLDKIVCKTFGDCWLHKINFK